MFRYELSASSIGLLLQKTRRESRLRANSQGSLKRDLSCNILLLYVPITARIWRRSRLLSDLYLLEFQINRRCSQDTSLKSSATQKMIGRHMV
jgi:hypothetical protein